MIHCPGASSDTKGATFEKDDTVSSITPDEPSSLEATLTAAPMQAGNETALAKPSSPEAMTVAIPAAFRFWMIVVIAGRRSSHVVTRPNPGTPRLMLTAAKLYVWRSR